jgi:hypothetical protein
MVELLRSLVQESQKRIILCVIGVGWGLTNDIRSIAHLEMGEHAQAYEVANGHLLGHQEWVNPMRVASGDAKGRG